MFRQFLVVATIILFSFGILFISITQTAQVKYSFNGPTTDNSQVLGDEDIIQYYFPYPGRVLPDNSLWHLKAARDRLWIMVTPRHERKAELDLLFANKRVVASKILFERDKPELAFTVLTKAQKYLEQAKNEETLARANGVDTKSFLLSLTTAALKHRETIREILAIAPEDAKPEISKMEDFSKRIYQELKVSADSVGLEVPEDPF